MKTPTTKLPAYTDSEIAIQLFLALARVVASEAETRLRHAAWEAADAE